MLVRFTRQIINHISGPHQARTVGTQPYTYDASGNLTSDGGRTFTWTADQQPASITIDGVTETYAYDADGARVKRSRVGKTAVYLGMLYEEDLGNGEFNRLYTFNDQVVAIRGQSDLASTLTYLHADHLGSLAAGTSGNAVLVGRQDYTPWGAQRGTGEIDETWLDYTGQRTDKDFTGLVFLNARYYDPVVNRRPRFTVTFDDQRPDRNS